MKYLAQPRFIPIQQQSGFAFLLLITAITLTTTILLTGLASSNKDAAQRSITTLNIMQRAQDALLGYALSHATPGTLPCPDTSGNGLESRSGTNCTALTGWLPYQTLGLDNLKDASGTPLSYSVQPSYAAPTAPFNSSTSSQLTYNGTASAFILIAPNAALSHQTRSLHSLPVGRHYLEGINADSNAYTFAYAPSDNNNDQLLHYSVSQFWQLIEEKVVLPQAIKTLSDYRSHCSHYPWAATFNAATLNSHVGQLEGSLPMDNPIPASGGCTSSLSAPSWFRNHWAQQLLYRFCTSGSCLSITGHTTSNAAALMITPGPTLTGQNRASSALNHYFEHDNYDTDTTYHLLSPKNHSVSFNDVLQFIP